MGESALRTAQKCAEYADNAKFTAQSKGNLPEFEMRGTHNGGVYRSHPCGSACLQSAYMAPQKLARLAWCVEQHQVTGNAEFNKCICIRKG